MHADEITNVSSTKILDRIMLTIPGNPATSCAATWRTAYKATISIGEIALLDASPSFEGKVKTVYGKHAPWEEDSHESMGHRVVFDSLIPNTKYAYRVGNGVNWSEWFQIETSSDKEEPFTLLCFGDLQKI